MDKIELIQKIEEATGMGYHAEDFKYVKDIIWNYYIDSEMFTENEIQIATGLTGYNEDTLNNILFIVYGYRDLIQYLESEVLNESTLNENRIEVIWDINPNVIVQQLDIRDINKAIRSRRSGGEDETGSSGLWDLAFEETLNYLFHEVGLNDLTNEEHHEYTLLAEEVYDILIANEENYVKGRRPILNESTTGFTIEYPNGDFYIGEPMDLYTMMTDFLINWDEDKTTMTEYEAENVASIRENYEEVFYAALEGGNYWKAEDFEEAFGRFSNYGIANAL